VKGADIMKDIRSWIEACEREGELKRIRREVDWDLELSHIASLNESRGGPALLFENVKGSEMPVLTSMVTTARRMAITLDLPLSYSMCDMAREWMKIVEMGKLIKPVEVKDNIPVMEKLVEGDKVNLLDFPSPRFFPQDGGRYIGTALYLASQDPETGWTNLGIYRMQLFDEKTMGANVVVPARHVNFHLKKYQKMGKKMPVAVVLGDHLTNFVVASSAIPEGVDEYDMIGALRGEPVEIFRSDLTGLMLPANAEAIFEGEIEDDPDNLRSEGPLGEYTGYYSERGAAPKPWLNVKRILRRENPIFQVSLAGRPVSDTHMVTTLNRSGELWADLEVMKIPGIQAVYCPPEACGRFWVIVSVKTMYPGHANQVGEAVIASRTGHNGVKGVIIIDADVSPDDMAGVWWSMAVRYNPITDTELIKKARSSSLDVALPIGTRVIGSRIIIDATMPYEWEKKPIVVELDEEMKNKISAKWQDYGFENPY